MQTYRLVERGFYFVHGKLIHIIYFLYFVYLVVYGLMDIYVSQLLCGEGFLIGALERICIILHDDLARTNQLMIFNLVHYANEGGLGIDYHSDPAGAYNWVLQDCVIAQIPLDEHILVLTY